MTSPWRNFSDHVFANGNWCYLLISASDVHWRVQPAAARQSGRFNKMHGALRALLVYGHLLTLQSGIPWRYSRERRMKLFWDPEPNAKWVSELKVALVKILWDHFPQANSSTPWFRARLLYSGIQCQLPITSEICTPRWSYCATNPTCKIWSAGICLCCTMRLELLTNWPQRLQLVTCGF